MNKVVVFLGYVVDIHLSYLDLDYRDKLRLMVYLSEILEDEVTCDLWMFV